MTEKIKATEEENEKFVLLSELLTNHKNMNVIISVFKEMNILNLLAFRNAIDREIDRFILDNPEELVEIKIKFGAYKKEEKKKYGSDL